MKSSVHINQLVALIITYAANHCVDLVQLITSQSRPPVFFFVDNLYAINTGTGRWTAKSNPDAVATFKPSLLTLRALTTVAAHWFTPSFTGMRVPTCSPNVVPMKRGAMVILTPRYPMYPTLCNETLYTQRRILG